MRPPTAAPLQLEQLTPLFTDPGLSNSSAAITYGPRDPERRESQAAQLNQYTRISNKASVRVTTAVLY
ncbi:hypothetical protein GN956_G19770 [Arapaima gigas]